MYNIQLQPFETMKRVAAS